LSERGGADDDGTIPRLKRNSLVALAVLTVGTAVLTRGLRPTLGTLVSGLLMVANFYGLESVVESALGHPEEGPGVLQMAFLAGRFVLLGVVLCVIVLLPGVGVFPVVAGLSVLIVALLFEALTHLMKR
jgi:hypothetical protein